MILLRHHAILVVTPAFFQNDHEVMPDYILCGVMTHSKDSTYHHPVNVVLLYTGSLSDISLIPWVEVRIGGWRWRDNAEL